ncbi:Uncharacterized conserved protein [Cronobacter sakazakii]|nr:Uncharacterized conserved protein [Cronobacter sakazakii]
MEILVTGGTGLIGRTLTSRLVALGHHVTVLTRNPERARARLDTAITLVPGLDHFSNLDTFDAVINLAGEPIADKRWNRRPERAPVSEPLADNPATGGDDAGW